MKVKEIGTQLNSLNKEKFMAILWICLNCLNFVESLRGDSFLLTANPPLGTIEKM